MSPTAFTFTLTVPIDPQAAAIVTAVARHTATYAGLAAAAGADFVTRVSVAAAIAFDEPSPSASCRIVVTSDATALTVTIGAESVSARHAS